MYDDVSIRNGSPVCDVQPMCALRKNILAPHPVFSHLYQCIDDFVNAVKDASFHGNSG